MYQKKTHLTMKRLIVNSLLIIFILSPSLNYAQTDNFLKKLLHNDTERFTQILKNPSDYHIQVIYTKIDRNKNNLPTLKTYYYNVEEETYFYPASTVKLPAILLAFEKINNLNVPGLTKFTPMLTDSVRPSQTSVQADTTAENHLPSLAHYARKILLASDNDAFNRLYEFLGLDYFNEKLHEKGYAHSRITHRLDIPLTAEENRYTNPVRFVENGKILYEQPAAYSTKLYVSENKILLGKAYVAGNEVISSPMDFSEKNFFSLKDQHEMLKALFFPDQVAPQKRFNLTPEDYRFIYQYMSQLPMETEYPAHYSEDLYDAYTKFILFGSKQQRLPRHVRSFNKSGNAYGFLIDNAYIADFERGIEFLVSAVIYSNKDEVLNDNQYDYETIGLPFMENLGKILLQYEIERNRKRRPDLDLYEVEYDK